MFLFWRVDDGLRERKDIEYLEDAESQKALIFGKSKVRRISRRRDVSTASDTTVRSVEDGAEKRPLVGNF